MLIGLFSVKSLLLYDSLIITKIREKCMVVSLPMPDVSNVYHSACVWPTALKLGCITNFDILFLVMGFISLVDEIR